MTNECFVNGNYLDTTQCIIIHASIHLCATHNVFLLAWQPDLLEFSATAVINIILGSKGGFFSMDAEQ